MPKTLYCSVVTKNNTRLINTIIDLYQFIIIYLIVASNCISIIIIIASS